jgi:hypothetical protein
MDANQAVQIEIMTDRRKRGLIVHEDTLERLEDYMGMFEELFEKWTKCKIDLEGVIKLETNMKKVLNLKVKIYRKIFELKKYAYVRSLRESGSTIFRYLKTFSLDYHYKHLLWHSPFREGLN